MSEEKNGNKIFAHGKKHWTAYAATTLAVVASIITSYNVVSKEVDKIVTHEELTIFIREHDRAAHDTNAARIRDIYLSTLQNRLERLLLAKCDNPTLGQSIDPTIRDLVSKYNEVASERWRSPTCQALRAFNNSSD